MLRLGWKCKFDDPESMKIADLKESIGFRGFDPLEDEAVKIDDMLPPFLEPDDRWLLRRAATEVAYDSGSCFREFGNMLLVDPFNNENGGVQAFLFSTMPNMCMPSLMPRAFRSRISCERWLREAGCERQSPGKRRIPRWTRRARNRRSGCVAPTAQ